jgi:hypothetical protein
VGHALLLMRHLEPRSLSYRLVHDVQLAVASICGLTWKWVASCMLHSFLDIHASVSLVARSHHMTASPIALPLQVHTLMNSLCLHSENENCRRVAAGVGECRCQTTPASLRTGASRHTPPMSDKTARQTPTPTPVAWRVGTLRGGA